MKPANLDGIFAAYGLDFRNTMSYLLAEHVVMCDRILICTTRCPHTGFSRFLGLSIMYEVQIAGNCITT